MLFAIAEVLSPAMIRRRRLMRYTLSASVFCKVNELWSSTGVKERSRLQECQGVCLGKSFLQNRSYQECTTCIKPARISWLFPLGDGTALGGSINLVAQKGFILTRLTQAGTVWFPEGHISSRSSVLHNVQVTMIYGSPHCSQHRHNWGTWEQRLEKTVHGNMDCDLSSLKDVTQESHSF